MPRSEQDLGTEQGLTRQEWVQPILLGTGALDVRDAVSADSSAALLAMLACNLHSLEFLPSFALARPPCFCPIMSLLFCVEVLN